MESGTQTGTVSKLVLWAGRIISVLVALAMLMSGVMKLMPMPPEYADGLKKIGWEERMLLNLAIVEITCAVLYAIPWTAGLGAILLTGYLGGAIATHVRVDEPFIAPLILGVMVWLGLFLRDKRVRALVPLRFCRC